ncbi:hypothetical protein ABZW44_22645 [Streptomyces mirabilis]|uniref:hypothetical protein n=1 Tax=Streptomyces mirabilis TaxID=68239 RepID=UPI0033AC6591
MTDPTPLPDQQLAAIEARLAAATPGPWTVSEDYDDVLDSQGAHLASYWNPSSRIRNGEFIAHARADVPLLAGEVRRLRAEVAAAREDTASGPAVKATRYTVNCLPEDSIDSHVFEITVEYRGHDRWAVTRHSQCLAADGTWDWEMRPSERENDWLDTHRFDLDTALKLAREQAPLVTVNGFTVADALRMAAERSAAERPASVPGL